MTQDQVDTAALIASPSSTGMVCCYYQGDYSLAAS